MTIVTMQSIYSTRIKNAIIDIALHSKYPNAERFSDAFYVDEEDLYIYQFRFSSLEKCARVIIDLDKREYTLTPEGIILTDHNEGSVLVGLDKVSYIGRFPHDT